MKHLFFIITILTMMLSCQSNNFQSVDVSTFATTIADTSVILLDVRTQAEYNEGHIPNALLIDAMQSDFVMQVEQLITKDKTIALYCRSGRRSKQAAAALAAEGFTIIELHTGFISWTAEGYIVKD